MAATTTRTFQMRLAGERPELAVMAEAYQRTLRTLYARARRENKGFDAFKTEFCRTFGLSARQFNAIRIDLAARVASVKEKALDDINDLEDGITRITKRIDTIDAKDAPTRKDLDYRTRLVAKRERLHVRKRRLEKIACAEYPPICFGSKRAFKAQHHLTDNGFGNHGAWLMHWRLRRSSEFQVVGADDEPSGNKTCRARITDDGSVVLHLTTLGGAKVALGPLVLPYGHDEWLHAVAAGDVQSGRSLAHQRETAALVARYQTEGWPADVLEKAQADGIDPEKAFRRLRFGMSRKAEKHGRAISYRFKRDVYGWRLFVTIRQSVAMVEPDYANGAIGIDMNGDHLALASVDASGAPVGFARIDTPVANKSSGRRLALYRDAAAAIVKKALQERRPIVCEELDFRAKRRRLAEIGAPGRARMLSSFATSLFKQAIVSAAKRAGVGIAFVNPAFTSVVGLTRAVPLGVSVHLAAALTIARRAMAIGETITETIRVPGGHRIPDVLHIPEDLRSKALDATGSKRLATLIAGVLAARSKGPTGKERRRARSERVFLAGPVFDTG